MIPRISHAALFAMLSLASCGGGTVMLERPACILPKECIDFKKVGKAGTPVSTLKEKEGEAMLKFYIPVEGKDTSAWIEVTLKLNLNDEAGWKGGPCMTTGPK